MERLVGQENMFYLFGGISTFTIENIVFNITISTLLGLFIYYVYKKTFSGVTYSQSFNVTIVMISLITAIVMMSIRNNLALSLGMVGALSIVRFRTAIKEPRDIGFLFWAIAVGLAAGTNEFMIAVIGSIMIAGLLFIFNRVIYTDYSYLLVLKGGEIETQKVAVVMKECRIPFKLRMRTTYKNLNEITYEITLKSMNEDGLIKTLKTINGIEEVHVVSYNGEVSG
jgi:uncharacterized membrane protein YhiD involved in acid resistance